MSKSVVNLSDLRANGKWKNDLSYILLGLMKRFLFIHLVVPPDEKYLTGRDVNSLDFLSPLESILRKNSKMTIFESGV